MSDSILSSQGTRRRSQASQILNQARRAFGSLGEVTPLTLRRVEERHDESGTQILEVVFGGARSEKLFRHNISFLLRFPNLKPLFCEGLLIWGGRQNSSYSRLTTIGSLRRGFFRFLAVQERWDIHPHEISEELLSSFYTYLHEPGINGQPAAPTSVANALGAVRQILSDVCSEEWGALGVSIAERIPPGPAGAARKTQPVEVLSLDQVLSIIKAAEDELETLKCRWENGRSLLEAGRIELAKGNLNYRNSFALCLAQLDSMYPSFIPDAKDVIKDDRELGLALMQVHGARNVRQYLYPTSRDLVAPVLLLTFATVFNPDSVLTLRLEQIEEYVDPFGRPVIKIVAEKSRANRDLVRLLDATPNSSGENGIKSLLNFVLRITERLRPTITDSEHVGRLFQYIQKIGPKRPKSFGHLHHSPPSADAAWVNSLKDFIKSNRLEHFTLGQLRPTLLNMAMFLNGDLRAAQELGNHRNPYTTWTFYTSSGVRKRFQERIGECILLRQRYFDSSGAIDPRILMPSQDRAAATPGFICLDPFDSPRPNQETGRFCRAYGECPSCPLAGAIPYDPISAAQYFELREAIYRSQTKMNPQTWLKRWAPVLLDLNELLELIPEEVVRESKKFNIALPTVG